MPKLAYRTTNPDPSDPDIAQRFSDAIRAGHPVATAAVLAGISERTARRYLLKEGPKQSRNRIHRASFA